VDNKDLIREAINELTAYIDDAYKYREQYKSEYRKWVRDMQLVWDLKAMLDDDNISV
jgi:hypothetical protein